MEKLRSFFMVSIFAALTLSVYQCGGSDDAGDEDEPADAEDAESGDVASATAAGSGLTDSLGSSTSSASENVSALMRSGIKYQTVEIPEDTITMDCPSGGSMDITTSGTATVEGDSAALDLTSTTIFNDCIYEASVTLEDGSTCDFSGGMDGTITCTLVGSAEAIDFNCSTASACDGITVTLGDEIHTGGFDIGVDNFDAMSGGTPDFTGDVCIDDTTFAIEDLADMQVPSGELTCIE